MTTTTNGYNVKIIGNGSGSPAGKVCDAELHFTDGVLAGLKLVGFSVWSRRDGGRSVVMPARSYSVNGERRSFALLRPQADAATADALRDIILRACEQAENEIAQAS